MIPVPSEIEGKEARYGDIEEAFSREGFVLGGNWDYEGGYFDSALEREGGETIYLRLPVQVLEGELDASGARLRFLQPLLVRHVVNTEIFHDDSLPLLDQMPLRTVNLLNQFQTPLETDGEIHNKEQRIEKAKEAIQRVLAYIQ